MTIEKRLSSLALRLLALCLLAGSVLGLATSVAAQTIRITEALSTEGDSARFPTETVSRMVPLPDDWADSRPGSAGPVWYRVAFVVDEKRRTAELLALHIARVCTNVEVFVNGELVHSGGRMSGRITQNCSHPQLVSLPAALLKPGLNVVDLKVVGQPVEQVVTLQRAGGLSALELGTHRQLAPLNARWTALQSSVPQGVTATLLLMGGFLFLIGWVNRRASHLTWFGLLSICWGLLEARLWLRDLPMGAYAAEIVLGTLAGLLTLCAVRFLLVYGKRNEPWVNLALVVQAALVPLSMLVAGRSGVNFAAHFWFLLFGVQILASAVLYLAALWRSQRQSFWLMGALMSVTFAAMLVEFAGVYWPWSAPVVVGAQILTPVMMLLLGMRLVHQHGQALQTSEANRAALEHRVAEISEKLQRNFEQLAELRVEQVTLRERRRIAGDLHDDLGAKLLTIVHTSESERISNLAREALDEMRLSVKGLTGKPMALADALADWRSEVMSRLTQAGIDCEWNMPEEDLPQTLSARAFVQTTRILREATSNIIKHSGATRCTIRISVSDGDFNLTIQDNGEGIAMEPDGLLDRGHGVSSMKNRAKQLAGQCLVESGVGRGTVIRLTLPLAPSLEPL